MVNYCKHLYRLFRNTMQNQLNTKLNNFKNRHADMFAWLYSTCAATDNRNDRTDKIRADLLKVSTILDTAKCDKMTEQRTDLVEHIRRKVGIKAIDSNHIKLENAVENLDSQQAAGWKSKFSSLISIDLGMIEELFDDLIEGIKEICAFVVGRYENVIRKSNKLLEELNIIIQDLQKIRASTPTMLHLQTRIETSQAAQLA